MRCLVGDKLVVNAVLGTPGSGSTLDYDGKACKVAKPPKQLTTRQLPFARFPGVLVSRVDGGATRMDVEEFYEQDPRRQSSDETEFGRDWYEGDMRFEVAWIADTGEVYAMAEPYSRRGITTESVTVEVLGIVEGRDAVDALLSGWEDAMAKPDGLAWVRAKVSRS